MAVRGALLGRGISFERRDFGDTESRSSPRKTTKKKLPALATCPVKMSRVVRWSVRGDARRRTPPSGGREPHSCALRTSDSATRPARLAARDIEAQPPQDFQTNLGARCQPGFQCRASAPRHSYHSELHTPSGVATKVAIEVVQSPTHSRPPATGLHLARHLLSLRVAARERIDATRNGPLAAGSWNRGGKSCPAARSGSTSW